MNSSFGLRSFWSLRWGERMGMVGRIGVGEQASVAEWLMLGLMAGSVVAIAAFVGAAIFRLGYPFPLEVTETASLEQVKRILAGQALYVAPTLQHVPLVYGPVYFYLAAGLATILDATYLPLRLLSLLAATGSLALVMSLVRHETTSWRAALASAGLVAATYPLAGTVLDMARVDALFVFWLLVSLVLVRTRSDSPSVAAAGLAMGLAALTKIPLGAAPVAIALAFYLAVTLRARALLFVLGALLIVGAGLLLLRLQTGPWPTWYLWDLPRQHVVNDGGDFLWRYWIDIAPRFTFPLLLGPIFVLVRMSSGDRKPLWFYAPLAAALIGVSWAARSNSGGATNVLLPTDLLIGIFFGLGLYTAVEELGARSARTRILQAYLVGLCLLQLGLVAYNPRPLVPYRSEAWAAERLSTALENPPGTLFAPDLDGYVLGSDKGEQPHMGAVFELLGAYGGPITAEGEHWVDDLDAALRERRFTRVVVNNPCCEIQSALERNGYLASGPLFPPGDEYWLWTMGRTPGELQVFVAPPAVP